MGPISPKSSNARMQQTNTMQEEGIIDFTKPWEYSDVIFIVEDQNVYANKMILSMSSPVMKAMFESDFRETHSEAIKLPGKTLNVFLDLMKAVHPPNQFKEENAERLVPLAHEYQMTQLMSLCEKFLLHDPQVASLSQLVLADRYGLRKLRAVCIEYAKEQDLNTLRGDETYDQIDPISKVEILEHYIDRLNQRVNTLSAQQAPLFNRNGDDIFGYGN